MMMASFLTPLRTEKIGVHRWLLIDDLAFHSFLLNGIFVCTRGFQTDYASLPIWLGSLFPRVGLYDAPGVLHDAAYAGALTTLNREGIWLTKTWADRLFYEALCACGVSLWRASVLYQAVAWFGRPMKHPLADHQRAALGEMR
jgi:hypothetical protein